MTRPLVLVDELDDDNDGHPHWCPADHRCTARWSSGGEHVSIPEIWRTDIGRVVATRHRDASTGAGHLEVRVVLQLPADETRAQRFMRWAIAAAYVVLSKAGS
jgi:hypothetical protein